MADLRDLLAKLGFDGAMSLLQSGNLVFAGRRREPAQLEKLFERELKAQLGVDADFFVRTAAEWREIVARNPFRAEAKQDPARLVVMTLKDAPERGAIAGLQRAIVGREVVRGVGRQLYAVYPDGMGRSRLTLTAIERALGTRGTARNWNTAMKIARCFE